jgi:glucose-6-phosphate isomerase
MSNSPISIDYSLCMAEAVGPLGGLSEVELDAEQASFERAASSIFAQVERGSLGFWGLPTDRAQLAQVRAVRGALPSTLHDVLVLGIGGSSLGARAIHQALRGPLELAGIAKAEGPRLHFPDNSDPWLLAALLDALDPAHTVALVVSKSGGTVETAAQLLVIEDWLSKQLDARAVQQRIVAITDPKAGPLRANADERGWATLAVPPNVGGRFSLLSPVGLLPAALGGVDVDALLDGASAMADACRATELRKNPAGTLAAVHVLQHRLRGRGTHVMMPYSDQLRPFAAWYVQLWAESLGKRSDLEGRVVERGPTAIAAVGATDQHAQMQLFMEGPRDKLLTFVRVEKPTRDLVIPHSKGPTAYLGGTTLHHLLDAERQGTTQALASDGRPSLTISLPSIDAAALGALFFLYEAATAFAGELYGVHTFDQPGVEHGKRLAYGLLGREGYEPTGAEVRTLQAARPTKYRV